MISSRPHAPRSPLKLPPLAHRLMLYSQQCSRAEREFARETWLRQKLRHERRTQPHRWKELALELYRSKQRLAKWAAQWNRNQLMLQALERGELST